jgi:peptide/nickel transport system permease protein
MKAKLGAFIFLSLLILAFWGLFQTTEMNLPLQLEKPSLSHPFGLDQNGSDILILIAKGAANSIKISLIVVLISTIVGVLIGMVSGWRSGLFDLIVMRITELFMSFPGFLLNLFLVSVLGPSIEHLIFALCLTSWTSIARLVRSEVMHLRHQDSIVAAVALGANIPRIFVYHLLPNIMGLLLVQMCLAFSSVVLSESALSYLGLGAPIDTPSWGALLNAGRKMIDLAPHVSLFPALAIFLLVLSLNLITQNFQKSFAGAARSK